MSDLPSILLSILLSILQSVLKISSMAIVVFVGSAAPLLAQGQILDVRPGLWEMTTERTSSGMPAQPAMPAIPPEVLAQMSPAQRAQIASAMSSRGKAMSGSNVTKVCVTAETLRKGHVLGIEQDPSCKRTRDTRTARMWQLQETCLSGGRQRTLDIDYQAVSREAITGSVNVAMIAGAQSMTMKQAMRGRWLGADCGNVKPK